ncbi:MAG: peptide deformylase [Lachnospiraceae bacterium]|nr:peptide deformylase [Lachnospiraceae bacterium]
MALRQIREMGDPILEKKSKEVKEITPRLKELLDDMWDTLHDAQGVGLAAVQVGILKRLFIVEISEDEKYTFVNPRIVLSEGEQTDYEGCLSVPGKVGKVTRPDHVIIEAFDEHMNPITVEGNELLARAMCHEFDHLEGRVYVDLVEGGLYDADAVPEED